MKTKLTALFLCAMLIFSAVITIIPISAEDNETITNGLVAWYDGVNNTENGHDASSEIWYDLAGNNDITLNKDSNNYFTDDAFHLEGKQNKFPSAVKDVINGNEFTVELSLGEVTPVGKSYATFINNEGNDNFALFLRRNGNYIEFKFCESKENRPKVSGGLEYFKNSTITITFKVGGKVNMYVDGVLISQANATASIGADGDLFFGHSEETKTFKADYRSMKFYNRALTEGEVRSNAGISSNHNEITKNGLVSWYDGVNNTKSGHDASSPFWYDLAGNNNITLTTNDKNYFTDDAFHLENSKNDFPAALTDVINGSAFTVELSLGGVTQLGSSYATFLNSTGNDNFALFIRNDGNYIELKTAKNERPKVAGGLEYFKDSTVAITFNSTGNITMYVDGTKIAQTTAETTVGAEGNIFFGHEDLDKNHVADYRAIRFYNRELSATEILNNARSDSNAERQFASVQQPKTNIVGDICLSAYVECESDLTNAIYSGSKPANLIFFVNDKLETTNRSFNTVFSTVDEVLEVIGCDFIPTFYVKDAATAVALANYLNEIKLVDANIMSNDPDAVKSAREAYPHIRGIVDFSKKYTSDTITEEELIEIRKTTISSLCHVAVIPQKLATQENVDYLNSRQITTWVYAPDTVLSAGEAVSLLVSGAYGIISESYEFILDAASEHIKPNSITRSPLIIGHRGIPSTFPENTLEGAIEAYKQGADVIEIDLYITTDNVVVVNHDATTSKYNQSLNVESSTYEQLKKLTYKNSSYHLPTLEQFLVEFKDKDVMLFLEIKSGKSNIVGAIKALVDKYDAYSQCAVIVFEATGQLDNLKNDYPEMPVGYLTSDAYSGSFAPIQKTVTEHNTSYNPSFASYTADFVREATMRGVTTWPWTVNNTDDIMSNIKYGHSGITTNYCNVTKNMANGLIVDYAKKASYEPNDKVTLTAKKSVYAREELDATVDYVILDGADIATISDGVLSFTDEGTVTVMAVLTEAVNNLSYSIYSQPITFNVGDSEAPPASDVAPDNSNSSKETEPIQTDAPAASDNLETEAPAKKKGCRSAFATGAIIVGIVAALGAATIIKKKD